MAERPFSLNIPYVANPSLDQAVGLGFVYIGNQDLDPSIEANRKTVVVVQENGTRVVIQPSAQPLTLGVGGVILYQGSPVVVLVDGVYSAKVTNSLGAQVYYVPRANEFLDQIALNSEVLVPNGSFESVNALSEPDNWVLEPTATGAIEIDTVVRNHGANSLRFTSVDASGAGVAKPLNRFPCGVGNNIYVGASYRATVVSARFLIEITWYDSLGAPISTATILEDNSPSTVGFDRLETVITTVPINAVFADMQVKGMAAGGAQMIGSMYVDLVVVGNARDYVFVKGAQVIQDKTLQNCTIEGGTIIPIGVQSLVGVNSRTFTLPTWPIKNVIIDFRSLDFVGADTLAFQIGGGTGFATSGYTYTQNVSGAGAGVNFSSVATAFITQTVGVGANVTGRLSLRNLTLDEWTINGQIGDGSARFIDFVGFKGLTETLTQIRIFTPGLNNFSAGFVNVYVEG